MVTGPGGAISAPRAHVVQPLRPSEGGENGSDGHPRDHPDPHRNSPSRCRHPQLAPARGPGTRPAPRLAWRHPSWKGLRTDKTPGCESPTCTTQPRWPCGNRPAGEGGSAAPAESARGFPESFDLSANLVGVRLSLGRLIVGVDPDVCRPTGRPHDQRQLPYRDATAFRCDAIGGPGPASLFSVIARRRPVSVAAPRAAPTW